MTELTQDLLEGYAELHPEEAAATEVRDIGSGAGLQDLIAGEASIAKMSRPLTAREQRRFLERRVLSPDTRVIAFDAVEIAVHPANPVTSLDLKELAGVFTGGIDDWSALGGTAGPIHVHVRDRASGTRSFFQERVMASRPYAAGTTEHSSNGDLLAAVAADPYAIGFGSDVSANGAHVLPLEGTNGEVCIASPETIASGCYPLLRELVMVTVGPPRGASARFLEYARGEEARRRILALGLVPFQERPATSRDR